MCIKTQCNPLTVLFFMQPHSEGIDVVEEYLYFVSKELRMLFILNLDDFTYTSQSTRSGLFWGQPDQVNQFFSASGNAAADLMYFTEDGGKYAGIHARNHEGKYFTILESHVYADETTGLSFSPNGKHMYIAYQDNGLLFDITRRDGLPFFARTLNVKYHHVNSL